MARCLKQTRIGSEELVERILSKLALPNTVLEEVRAVACSSTTGEEGNRDHSMHGTLSQKENTWWISSTDDTHNNTAQNQQEDTTDDDDEEEDEESRCGPSRLDIAADEKSTVVHEAAAMGERGSEQERNEEACRQEDAVS